MAEEKKEIEPSALWLALTQLPRPTRAIPFPRNNPETGEPVGEIIMWPLTQEEQMASNAEADRYTKTLLKDPQKKDEANLGYNHTYQNEIAIQVLYRACRSVEDQKRPAFPSPNHMRQLSTDEVGVLFNQYCTVQSELGPIVAHLDDEEFEALVLRLVEGGSAFPFEYLSWEAQRTLVRTLASRLLSSWMDTCSAGRPLGCTPRTLEKLRALLEKLHNPLPTTEPAPIADGETPGEEPVAIVALGYVGDSP